MSGWRGGRWGGEGVTSGSALDWLPTSPFQDGTLDMKKMSDEKWPLWLVVVNRTRSHQRRQVPTAYAELRRASSPSWEDHDVTNRQL